MKIGGFDVICHDRCLLTEEQTAKVFDMLTRKKRLKKKVARKDKRQKTKEQLGARGSELVETTTTALSMNE